MSCGGGTALGSRAPVSAGPHPRRGHWCRPQGRRGRSGRCASCRRAERSAAAAACEGQLLVGVVARPWGGPEAKPIPLHPYSMTAPQRFLPAPSLSSERRMSPCSLRPTLWYGMGSCGWCSAQGAQDKPLPGWTSLCWAAQTQPDCRERRCHSPKLSNPKKSQESPLPGTCGGFSFLLFLPLRENSSRKIYESNLKSKGPGSSEIQPVHYILLESMNYLGLSTQGVCEGEAMNSPLCFQDLMQTSQ